MIKSSTLMQNLLMLNEEGTEPFSDECEHDKDRISFLEVMKPIFKRNYN
jgi:hypothetical protein